MKTAVENIDGMIATTAIAVTSQIATFKGQDYQINGTSKVHLTTLATSDGGLKLILSTLPLPDGRTMVQEVMLTLDDLDWLANRLADFVESTGASAVGETLQ